ncbi:MAG: D-alanyl-D-alanine carboxypeptidase [Clostridiales bacterium]|jgi:D-alanyl-D-alanine carboxypeptidase (penicillin-binding protein 5/6)|nr:D-alanyl-D-alanine carboxypeptidase [Clostridiales bacterium]
MNGSGNNNRKNENTRTNRQVNRNPQNAAAWRRQKPAINAFLPDDSPKLKQKKKGISGGAFLALVITACVVVGIVGIGIYAVINKAAEDTGVLITETALITGVEELPAASPVPVIPAEILGDETECQNALLVNVTTGVVIAEKNPDEIVYPASLTKIMTALVAVENIPDLEAKIMIDRDMVAYAKANNASTAGLFAGEAISARDLLYCLILPSGADAALGLAKLVSGSEQDFVKLMNVAASRLGMENTHFTNCTGLNDINHYSTAGDLYKLIYHVLKNQILYDLLTTLTYNGSSTNYHPDGVYVVSTIKRNYEKEGLDLGYVLGGKTGYTVPAKQCMATIARKDGEYYVLIVLGCGDGTANRAAHALVSHNLWERFLGKPQPESDTVAVG